MANEDEVSRSIIQKIEREKALITAANAMRQSTGNPAVLQGLDTKIRDGRKNIEYLESRLHDMSVASPSSGQGQSGYARPGEYGDPGQDYSQLSGGTNIMPPAAPFARPGPGQTGVRSRPNYSKLGKMRCNWTYLFSPKLTLVVSRSHQVRYPSSWTPHPTHAVPIGIQAQRRETIQGGN
jgi:Hr1 repeat